MTKNDVLYFNTNEAEARNTRGPMPTISLASTKWRYVVQRHADRTSVSFAENGADVEWIITVTFDNRIVEEQDDTAIAMLAHTRLIAFARDADQTE